MVLFCVHSGYFALGWLAFSRKLFPNYDVAKHRMVPLAFSLTVAFSLSMFSLILFDIWAFIDYETRWVNWKLDIYAMIVLLVFLVPPYMFYLIASKDRGTPHSKAKRTTTIAYTLWLLAFWLLGDPPIFIVREQGKHGPLSIEHLVSALAILGVMLIAILTGLGAVNGIVAHVRYSRSALLALCRLNAEPLSIAFARRCDRVCCLAFVLCAHAACVCACLFQTLETMLVTD